MKIKEVLFYIMIITNLLPAFSMGQEDGFTSDENDKRHPPKNLICFQKAYPDIDFIPSYDQEKEDWKIEVVVPQKDGSKKSTILYWCESRLLPENKLEEKYKYRRMLYKYSKNIPDPANFTEDDIKKIKDFTSKENRKNGAIDPPFLYNAIYDCETRLSTERHIKTYDFLTLSVNVHERIGENTKNVHKKIMNLKRDDELTYFFKTLNRTDGFNWRTVRDTQSRSFHSMGLAIDILPRGYYQKIIYWGWQKQLHPEDWYMTPISKRWIPPQKIIDIFWQEGFIWGGTWAVWDNMHFEYHPELIEYANSISVNN
ncbi:MAG: M15 family metallopeptidase [Treponema sp.]|nr:M15 family metallopeptidase [Treponema sp.]